MTTAVETEPELLVLLLWLHVLLVLGLGRVRSSVRSTCVGKGATAVDGVDTLGSERGDEEGGNGNRGPRLVFVGVEGLTLL